MQLSTKGKQIDVGDALRGHVEDQLRATVAKYLPRAIEGQVTFSREASFIRADILLHVLRGVTLQAHHQAADAYPAFDGALEKIAKRLRRYKRRLTDHHNRDHEEGERSAAQLYILAAENDADGRDHAEDGPDNPVIVAEMATEISTLTVGEAVMRLDLGDLPVLLFRNRGHGQINLVYRREDGHIGWIDPTDSKRTPTKIAH
ncbi:MAG: ribosome-associated translation inhibitor RaiA [Alphaproteobacteria bacterium]